MNNQKRDAFDKCCEAYDEFKRIVSAYVRYQAKVRNPEFDHFGDYKKSTITDFIVTPYFIKVTVIDFDCSYPFKIRRSDICSNWDDVAQNAKMSVK